MHVQCPAIFPRNVTNTANNNLCSLVSKVFLNIYIYVRTRALIIARAVARDGRVIY